MAMAKGAVKTEHNPRPGFGTLAGTVLRKTVRYGTMDRETYVAKIELRDQGKGLTLSVCGEVLRSGHFVAGGQNTDDFRRLLRAENGRVERKRSELAQLIEIWDRWHLNNMRAGCEHQRALGWDSTVPLDPSKPVGWGNYATWKRHDEHPNGLLCKPCPVCGYEYGSAWLHEPLPQEVVDFVEGLA